MKLYIQGRSWLLGAMGRGPIRFFELLGAVGRSPAPPKFTAETRINFLSWQNQQISLMETGGREKLWPFCFSKLNKYKIFLFQSFINQTFKRIRIIFAYYKIRPSCLNKTSVFYCLFFIKNWICLTSTIFWCFFP